MTLGPLDRSHFHDWIDYYGLHFYKGYSMGSHIFRILGVRKFGYVGL